jgi:hypothetical protein
MKFLKEAQQMAGNPNLVDLTGFVLDRRGDLEVQAGLRGELHQALPHHQPRHDRPAAPPVLQG